MKIEDLSYRHQDRIFHAIYQEIYNSTHNISFRYDVFAFYLFAYHIDDLFNEVIELVDDKALFGLLNSIEEQVISGGKQVDISSVDGFCSKNKLASLQQRIYNSSTKKIEFADENRVKLANDLVSLYQSLMSEGDLEMMNAIIFSRFTSYLNQETRKVVTTKLQPMQILWDISYNNDYTLERIIFLEHKYQTSTEEELAFHEILEKLIKTSSQDRLIQLIENLNESNDNQLLANALQHFNPTILKKICCELSCQKNIEKILQYNMSKRASGIYENIENYKFGAKEVKEKIVEVRHDENAMDHLLYGFFRNQNKKEEVVKLFSHFFKKDGDISDKLVRSATSAQLQTIYTDIVLSNIDNNCKDHKHYKDLGRMIYNEVKFRVNEGMSKIRYTVDVEAALKFWKEVLSKVEEDLV